MLQSDRLRPPFDLTLTRRATNGFPIEGRPLVVNVSSSDHGGQHRGKGDLGGQPRGGRGGPPQGLRMRQRASLYLLIDIVLSLFLDPISLLSSSLEAVTNSVHALN